MADVEFTGKLAIAVEDGDLAIFVKNGGELKDDASMFAVSPASEMGKLPVEKEVMEGTRVLSGRFQVSISKISL